VNKKNNFTVLENKNDSISPPASAPGFEEKIYELRFSVEEQLVRENTWKTLCQDFFQNYISSDQAVLDLGAGDGMFIRNISAKRKVAVDISPHVEMLREKGIEVLLESATDFADKIGEKVDVIFISNFFEHLPNKELILKVLKECREALTPRGAVFILQPNIKHVGSAYWDYIDHHIALTEESLREALSVTGFVPEKVISKFLPYTAKYGIGRYVGSSRISKFVQVYLRFPFLWRIFGKQTFIIARKKGI
jgi:SAM-dependent methyltransferase